MSGPGGVEATGRGLRKRARIEGVWYSLIVTLDEESGSTIVEAIPDEPEPPYRTKAARAQVFARVAEALGAGAGRSDEG